LGGPRSSRKKSRDDDSDPSVNSVGAIGKDLPQHHGKVLSDEEKKFEGILIVDSGESGESAAVLILVCSRPQCAVSGLLLQNRVLKVV